MKTERWQRLNDLFQSATERAPEERAAFLNQACHGDAGLRREVESLVASYEQAKNFIEAPAFEFAPELLTNDKAGALVGESIGHYRIESLLGGGGMGEVYLALDTRSKRKAVIKLLPARFTADAERIRRFQQEAQTVVALNHPNIVTIYEIGQENGTHYIISELIEGETLRQRMARGPMTSEKIIEIAVQVANALAAAHRAGVVHRDIKPENIMLRHDGYVKVLDFGIAKLAQPESAATPPDDHRTLHPKTVFGSTMGTLRYMSPEQVRGEHVDQRTDIWSFGVVLFELVAGAPPFDGQTADDVTTAIREAPTPLLRGSANTPAELRQIISKALEKNRDRRFARVNEMLEKLKQLRHQLQPGAESPDNKRRLLSYPIRVAAAVLVLALAVGAFFLTRWNAQNNTAASAPKSIAVLPLENRGADGDRYLADGIQEELFSRLSRIAGLKVISPASTRRYQNGRRNLVQIAKQLGVTYLLEGSVQRIGEQVRLELHLSNLSAPAPLWAKKYERPLDDIFALEGEITSRLAETLKTQLSDSNRSAMSSAPTQSSAAHELYLRGRYLAGKGDETDLKKAIDFYEQSIARDAGYALAYAGLAEAYVIMPEWGRKTPTQYYYGLTRTAAEKAVAYDPTLPEAHIALALAVRHEDRDFARAQQELQRAIELAPSSARAHSYLGYAVFAPQGDFDRAIAEMKRAVELDPLSAITRTNFGMCYLLARRYPEAIAQLQKSLELDPSLFPVHNHLGMALLLSDRVDEAMGIWKHAYELGKDYHALAALAYGYARKGDRAQALQVLRQLEELEQHGTRAWPLDRALVYLALGDKDHALQWLQGGAAENDSTVTDNIKVLPMLDPLRGDPRFDRLVSELIPPVGTRAESKSVAVLPFVNETGESSQAYLGNGLADQLINLLARVEQLRVASRHACFQYKGRTEDARAIGQALGVASLLEGSVQRAGERVQLNLQLIEAQSGRQQWAQSYNCLFADVTEVEGEVAERVANTLKVIPTFEERARLETRSTHNPEAYRLYLRGMEIIYHLTTPSRRDCDAAAALLQRAIALDPNFALAHAQLSYSYGLIGHLFDSVQALRDQAAAEAREALRLQPDLGEAHQALAYCYYWGGQNDAAALVELRIAKDLLPNDGQNVILEEAIARRRGHLGRAVSYGVNLLVNGNAEDGPASPVGAPVEVPGWTTSGAFTVVPYDAPAAYPALSQAPPNGLKQFFTGGPSGISTATQEIDVSVNAGEIDAGEVMCDISAWLGGYSDQEDDARFTVDFRNGAAAGLKKITLGPVTALERADQTGFKFRSSSMLVPAQTRRIQAALLLTRKTNAGQFNDGYADNLSIILRGPVVVTKATYPGGSSYGGLKPFSFWDPLRSDLGFEKLVAARASRKER
jgi:eukaryotic-like serine/threonine-protein kinase